MANAADIAVSAIRALDRAREVVANNLANMNTGGFQKSRAVTEQAETPGVTLRVEQLSLPIDTVSLGGQTKTASSVDPAEELVSLMVNRHSYDANIQALRNAEEMQGTLFDLFG